MGTSPIQWIFIGGAKRGLVRKKSREQPAHRNQTKDTKESDIELMKEKLKIIPLGGLNEIGKNMTVIEYGGDIVVIDCGVAFPDDDMLGVDLVIPGYDLPQAQPEEGARLSHHPWP